MDDERLQAATERWVDAGLIDGDTAADIREFEAAREKRSSHQLTTILAGMGAALIGAGILVFLGANWDGLPDWGRAAILVGVPVGLATGSLALDRRGLGRPATGTWILAAISVGPSLFLLADLYAPDLEATIPLFLWGAIAVPMGHAFRSRLGTGVGLVALLAAGPLVGDGRPGIMLAGAIATMYLAAAIPVRKRSRPLGETYRILGLSAVIGAFLWGTIAAGRFVGPEIPLDRTAVVGMLGALGVLAAVGLAYRRGDVRRAEASLVAVAAIGIVVLGGLLATLEPWPWLVGFFAVHGALLVVLIAFVSLALSLDAPILVNLLVVGFFLQIVTLLGPLTDFLPGALTLVVVGLILLGVAIALERVRRRLLERVVGH